MPFIKPAPMSEVDSTEWDTYHQVHESHYTTESLVCEVDDPFREYLPAPSNQRLLDIGCGQSSLVLKYAGLGSHATGRDVNQTALNCLRRRLISLGQEANGRVTLQEGLFPKFRPSEMNFTLAVVKDVLHFYTDSEQSDILGKLDEHLVQGSYIFIKCRSEKHFVAIDPSRDSRYKSFFNPSSMRSLFNAVKYDCLWTKSFEEYHSESDKEFMRKWFAKSYPTLSKDELESELSWYLSEGPMMTESALFRKR
ncbi:MAG TPA: class I SAM-dependent methyltransferase [Flavobacteriales bacterium]